MGFFSKSKHEKNGFIINTDDEVINVTGDKNMAPHAITPEEVSDLWIFGDEETYTNTSALDSLKKRMNVSTIKDKTEEPKPESKSNKSQSSDNSDKKENVETETKAQEEPKPKTIINISKTLVEKVKRYTVDDQGKDMSQDDKPLYELQSVAEILMNDGENAMKDLSKKYGLDIVVDDLGKKSNESVETKPKEVTKKEPDKKVEKPVEIKPTPAFEKMVSDAEIRESRELYKNLFPNDEAFELPDISVPDISDIDKHEVGIATDTSITNTATVRFTPVKDHKGNTDHITVSSITRHVDLGDNIPQDISSRSVPKLEHTEFDDFVPKDEYVDTISGKKLLVRLAKQKRSYFIGASISALMVFALSIFLLPPIYNFIISDPKSTMFTCTAFLLITVLANYDMFFDFKNLLSKRCNFDTLASLSSLLTLSLGITAAVTESPDAYYTILLCAITLLIRVIGRFKSVASKYINLKRIANDKVKNAVALISDPATTFAMAKNSIEGDVLIAAHKKTFFVENFIKHFDFHKTLSGKVSIVFYVTIGLCALCGLIAYFTYDNIFSAFFAATNISCLATIPCAFFIDMLPISSATKKLTSKGTMIAGLYGAEKIENANAVVVNITDIFPEGTVTLHNMKVLSNNNIDDILLRAASLTAAVGSPLESIFKKIAGTNSSYSIPDSDTVKYEKNLGISGWVNNEPMFIGNRSLMQAHGIAIPSLEVDKKILRKGYFPVYVATANTACALIVIQYNVDPIVSKELHKITNLGVTLLLENCDPNVTEEMLCDYFGLYDDSVKVMTSAGIHMYKNAVPEALTCSAPAAFRGSGLNFVKIINCASSMKRCNRLLTILYTVFAILGALAFVYAAFSGLMDMPNSATVLLYALGTTILSIIGFLIRKP
ncbi:MAG: hypothetical protein IKU82_03560 [Clostridia bacterium]|nr:hypothetical protein [Clostridia bacterium]